MLRDCPSSLFAQIVSEFRDENRNWVDYFTDPVMFQLVQ